MKKMACVICTEAFSEDSSILATRCGHVYHEECLQEWLNYRGDENQGSCPNCRQHVKISDCISVFPTFTDSEGNGISESEHDEKLALTESECKLKRYLELDLKQDPQMDMFNNVMHTTFTVLIVCLFMHFGCSQTELKFLTLQLEEHKLNDEDYINYEVVPFGYLWLYGMLLCLWTSILFGFWSEYLKQTGVHSFAKYLWVCMAPSCLQF